MFEFIHIAQAAEEVAKAEASGNVLGTFGVNWKFFIAQLINFSIVMYIFWRWVLTPVAKKLSERSEKISIALKDAERIQEEKKEFDVWKNSEMSKARQEASDIITKAESEATKVKEEVLVKAKEEQQKLVEQAKKQIETEKNSALQAAKGEMADLVTTATEKILKQKLDGKKDEQLIKESLKGI